ncbi:MAG: hypothetical protein WAT66_15840 [Actinomycetota bacterium]
MTGFYRGRRTTTSAVAAVLLASLAFALQPSAPAAQCPAGYSRADTALRRFAGISTKVESNAACVNDSHPESLADLEALAAQREAIRSAPYDTVPAGAIESALNQKRALWRNGQDAENSHSWQPIGRGPLQSADPGYGGVNSLGLVELAGRITSFAYVPAGDKHFPDTLFASVAYGGVWMTDGTVTRWVSIGDKLPTQIVGALGYTPAGGGTLIALTGDGSFGRYSREGGGAFYSRDGGAHWTHARGLPDEAFGFKVAVDQAHPNIVYAATGSGLYRSVNAGRSYKNVALPVGSCAGKSNRIKECLFANEVTDVAVKAPGGVTGEKGGQVLAAVGWRYGNTLNPDGTVQAPGNGIYLSENGAPGTFTKSAAIGFVPQNRIGRIELGPAIGPEQDHNILYAMVQDAVLVKNGLPGLDVPGVDFNKAWCGTVISQLPPNPLGLPYPLCPMPTSFNGVYVSLDWGQTWVLMESALELAIPGTGSALTPGEAALAGYGPGVQSWYNEWIKPDPTMADPVTGAPTRVLFGLEEVWENANVGVPQIGPSLFKVIGRYFAGSTCISILDAQNIVTGLVGLPNVNVPCVTNGTEAFLDETTTHPDQHDAVLIPQADGGVQLVVGNDGGVYKQKLTPGADFTNANWGDGANDGFNTLLPYDAVRAKDGTVWMGLQDNGTAKIVDIKRNGKVIERGRQIMTKGGDGFFVAVDPNNSNVAYGEYVGGAIASTSDGGHTWGDMAPPITDGQFSTPFVMDPRDARHLMIAGRQVVETSSGPGTGADDWAKVFDLGTALHPGDADAAATPEDPVNAMSAVDLVGPNAYVGYCGTCVVLNSPAPFRSGIATNVGGKAPAKKGTADGWHFAKAIGLPNRYITGISIDEVDPKTVYVSVGGYLSRWTPPGFLDKNERAKGGHVFVSHDAGEHFADISGNLPNFPVNWITRRGEQVIAATDIGVFISREGQPCGRGCVYQILGKGLPAAPVFTARLSPGDPNLLVVATWGRGVWSYRFGPAPKVQVVKKVVIPPPPFLGKLINSFDFEVDDQGWVATSNSSLEAWRRQGPGSTSSQAFTVTPYANEASATLTSPKMTVPARSLVKVQWDERLDTEDGFDYLLLDWSSDGKIWHTAFADTGKNAGFPGFETLTAQFVAPAGSLFVRFRLTSDQLVSSPPYTGAAVDNVMISR